MTDSEQHDGALRRRDAPRPRARRARARSPAATRRSAACCSTPTARSSPRAGTAAPAPPHAEVDALSARSPDAHRAHRRRHPRALQPHRTHRAVQRGAPRRRHRPRRLRDLRPGPPLRRRRRAPARRRRRGRGRRARRRGRGVPAQLAHRRAPRPPVGHREVGVHPRRPGGRIRRHQPVDHRHRRAPAGARAARRRTTRSSSAPAPCSPTTRRSPPAATPASCCPPAASGRRRRAGDARRMPRCAATRPASSRPRSRDLAPMLAELTSAASGASTSRAGPTLATALVAGGLRRRVRHLPRPRAAGRRPATSRSATSASRPSATPADCASSPSSSSATTS